MIKVTKLNGGTFHINSIFIEKIESFPDTTITLTNGHKYIVVETEEIVSEKIISFYQQINLLGDNRLGQTQSE